MLQENVNKAIREVLSERADLFLLDLNIDAGNKIRITIDGDHGITVDDCVLVSRAIEGALDREEEDFSLEVTSAGASEPLKHARQYKKHVGRALDVKTTKDEHFTAELLEADDKSIRLGWKVREPKPVGKGKRTVKKEAVVLYEDIEQAKVKIKF